MRRSLAILLLVLLPIQLSWASVTAYCQHEAGTQIQHFGHHEHQHHGAGNETGGKLPGGVDNDCGACQAGCVAAILDVSPALLPAYRSDAIDAYRLVMTSPPVAEPERPNWNGLA